jgi:hypothetical protein
MHGEEQIGAVFYNAPLAAGAPRGSRPWKPRALTDENGGSGSPVVECLPEKGAAGFAAVSCSVKSRWTGSRRRDLASRSGFACVRFALQNGNLHVACIELVHCYFLLLLIQCTVWYATKELRKCHWLSRRGWNFNFYGMK